MGLFGVFHVEHSHPRGADMTREEVVSGRQNALEAFATLLRASPHNLLSAKGLEEIESRHFPESVAFAESLPASTRLLDVGTGGGLPGIVIAIVRPDIEVHLLEATGKKARFLDDVATELGLSFTVHHGRAEALARPPLRDSFDTVSARAVAPLAKLSSWCAPYLRLGGRLHAIKGEQWRAELEASGDAIRRAGLRVVATPQEPRDERGGPMVVVLERLH